MDFSWNNGSFIIRRMREKDSSTDGTSDNLPNITGVPLVGTNQSVSYNSTTIFTKPTSGQDYYGQT